MPCLMWFVYPLFLLGSCPCQQGLTDQGNIVTLCSSSSSQSPCQCNTESCQVINIIPVVTSYKNQEISTIVLLIIILFI